jgi:hypothetical protein
MRIINCPSCQRRLYLPEDGLERSLQCPACHAVFEASDLGRFRRLFITSSRTFLCCFGGLSPDGDSSGTSHCLPPGTATLTLADGLSGERKASCIRLQQQARLLKKGRPVALSACRPSSFLRRFFP